MTGVWMSLSLAVLVNNAAATTDRPADDIKAVLTEQVAAWNKGDLNRFLATYWDDDHLTFYSGGTVTKGLKSVAERYRKNYQAEGKEMGKLSFSGMEVELLGPDA